MRAESARSLLARPRTLLTGTAMVVLAVAVMVVIPALARAAADRLLADLDALGSNAWIVTPQQLPGQPPALIPPGGLARASDLPAVASALHVVTTTQGVRRNAAEQRDTGIRIMGLDTTRGAPAVQTSMGVRRSVPGLPIAVAGEQAATALGISRFPTQVRAGGRTVIVTGVIRGDPLLPELDDAIITDVDTAFAFDPAATDRIVVRVAASVDSSAVRAAVDPLNTVVLLVEQPQALVLARAQSTSTLGGLSIAASAAALVLAAVGIAIMLTSSVRQRTAELAVRRVHGATARAITALISAEGLWIGALGGLLGLALSNLAVVVTTTVRDWPYRPDLSAQLLVLCIALGTCVVASLPPALVAMRVQPARAFAVE